MTDFPVTALANVEIASPDPESHARFYADVWGLEPVAHDRAGIFLAATGADPYVLALLPGAAPELLAVTFRCASAAALDAALDRAAAAGCRIVAAPARSDRPGGGIRAEIIEPRGCRIRLIHGGTPRSETAQRRARPVRLAHVNINTSDVDALSEFYAQVLGFRLTDRSKIMAFLRCNSDHHSVVLADAPVEGLNHIAFQLPGWEDVMLASGRMRDAGHPIGWGPGRHGPGDNVFAYFVDPAGYVVEHTAEVLQVGDDYRVGGPDDWVWPPGRTDQWGIAPPKTDACKAAQIAIGFGPG